MKNVLIEIILKCYILLSFDKSFIFIYLHTNTQRPTHITRTNITPNHTETSLGSIWKVLVT